MKYIPVYSLIFLGFVLYFSGCFFSNEDTQPSNDLQRTTQGTEIAQEGTLLPVFVLEMPDYSPPTKDLLAKQTQKIRFTFLDGKESSFLKVVPPTSMQLDYREPKELPKSALRKGAFSQTWKCVRNASQKQIFIDGFTYSSEGYLERYELDGKEVKPDHWEGTGLLSLGFGNEMPETYQRLFKLKWRLYLETETPKPDEQFLKIELLRKPPEPAIKIVEKTEEELQAERNFNAIMDKNYPIVRMNYLRSAKNHYPDNPLRHYSGSDPEKQKGRRYVRDHIVPDLEWSELDFLPESIVLIDHLATQEDKRVRETLAQVYAKVDQSFPPLMDQDLNAWTKVPLIFLLVHYSEWLTPERMAKLSGTTPRMRLLMTEIKKYGKDSPSHLDEIMESVLRQMPEKDRFDYFTKCLRLREYVKNAPEESLRSLLPQNLPDPPELQPNLRTWTEGEKTVRGAFFGLDKAKVTLSLLDPDGSEFALFYPDVSAEDKAYVEAEIKKREQAKAKP